MEEHDNIELHSMEVIEQNLNSDHAATGEELEGATSEGFMVLSPSGFMITSPSGFMMA